MPRLERTPEGIRPTVVGVSFVVFALLTGMAAVNTGNNALYMVLAVMLGVLTVSGVLSWRNVRGMAIELRAPEEIYAGRPVDLTLVVHNRSRWMPRRAVLVATSRQGTPRLVPRLAGGGMARGALPVLFEQRGRHRIEDVHLSSHYPFGFFRKGVRQRVELELLVYPQIFDASPKLPEQDAPRGELEAPRPGRGHELFTLREFRAGDDPRHIHWKQTARTGETVVVVHETERGRRLSIVLDNGVGGLDEPARRARFERLVSEAATAAVEGLRRGLEVELVTRDERIPFGAGVGQRRRILESLALIEPTQPGGEPLVIPGGQRRLQLALRPEEMLA